MIDQELRQDLQEAERRLVAAVLEQAARGVPLEAACRQVVENFADQWPTVAAALIELATEEGEADAELAEIIARLSDKP